MNKVKEHFPLPLHVKFINGEVWELIEPFEYITKKDETIHVPAKFLTDMASIPRIFQPIIGDPTGRYGPSAIIHDYIYYTKIYKRSRADAIFLEAMKVLGVPWWKRRTMWLAVRIAGWISWGNRKPLIPIILLLLCLLSISCSSLTIVRNEKGEVTQVKGRGLQETEVGEVKHKMAVEWLPKIPIFTN